MTAISTMRKQAGLTLVELMVALAVSMVIVIAAASFFVNSSKTRDAQEAATTLQDNARFVTDLITKNIQQAGYQNYVYGTAGSRVLREVAAVTEPDLQGYNNTAAGSSTDNGVNDRTTNRVNNSDTLVIRFQGSGSGTGDGSMIDCRGAAQPEPTFTSDRVFSIFEVRRPSATAEPELRCKYSSTTAGITTYPSEVIVRGVETLQFLYGVDTNGDSFVDRWLNAAEVNPGGAGAALAEWERVRSVRVGMVLRSATPVNVAGPTASTTLAPLGINFSQLTPFTAGATDNDTLQVSNSDGRLRKVVTFTVNLRNPVSR